MNEIETKRYHLSIDSIINKLDKYKKTYVIRAINKLVKENTICFRDYKLVINI